MTVKIYKINNDRDEIKYTSWIFPGGEVGVKLEYEPNNSGYVIQVDGIPTFNDVMIACQLNGALRQYTNVTYVSLFIPYFPYARQDRYFPGEDFALKTFITMLTSVSWNRIYCVDAHSNVVGDLMHLHGQKFSSEPQFAVFSYLMMLKHIDVREYTLVGPDKGSESKITENSFYNKCKWILMNKTRGAIGEVKHEAISDSIEGKAMIVDDICDGGATFLSAGKVLRETQPRMTELSLYVTHGIFSKGVDKLLEVFDNIYCFNVMSDDPTVKQLVKSVTK